MFVLSGSAAEKSLPRQKAHSLLKDAWVRQSLPDTQDTAICLTSRPPGSPERREKTEPAISEARPEIYELHSRAGNYSCRSFGQQVLVLK